MLKSFLPLYESTSEQMKLGCKIIEDFKTNKKNYVSNNNLKKNMWLINYN